MKKQKFLIRVDGAHALGYGHVMRCVGLIQRLKKTDFQITVATGVFDDYVLDLWRSLKVHVFKLDSHNEIAALKNLDVDWIVADLGHSLFLEQETVYVDYLNGLQDIAPVMMIDGMGAETVSSRHALDVSWVVVPYFGAKDQTYAVPEEKVLAGLDYYIFREEFLRCAESDRVFSEKGVNLLVSMGGTDPRHQTLDVLKCLRQLDFEGASIKIVVTSGFSAVDLQKIQQELFDFPHTVEYLVDAKNMTQLMNWADVGILNSGLTRYEAAFLGLPSLIVSLNESHEEMMDEFAKLGTCIHLGCSDKWNQAQIMSIMQSFFDDHLMRKKMSIQGRRVIDGCGVDRILEKTGVETHE